MWSKKSISIFDTSQHKASYPDLSSRTSSEGEQARRKRRGCSLFQAPESQGHMQRTSSASIDDASHAGLALRIRQNLVCADDIGSGEPEPANLGPRGGLDPDHVLFPPDP